MIRRDRNQVKYQSWHFYLLLHDDAKKGTETINKLTEACDSMTGRKPGGKNEPLKMERPTPKKVEITWPTPVSHDSCTRVLTKALGQNWKVYVSAPSGAGTRTQVPAATAETADEAESLEDIVGEAIEAAASAAAASPAAAAPGAPSSEAPAREAYARGQDAEAYARETYARGLRRHHLLSMILETTSRLYEAKDPTKYEVAPCPFEVDWDAELGQGTFGKVYFGALHRPGGGDDDVCALYAIKMLRDVKADEALGFNSDAVAAAEDEVKRHAALGYHPNVVRLNDVGLFTRSLAQEQRRLSAAAGRGTGGREKSLPKLEVHIGLVFDLYEIDVRQFLEKSSFTQSGVRHVLNSVLAGLGFIHDSGCVHCDVKPANILMRGTPFTRGCFEKPALAKKDIGDCDADDDTADQRRLEFHYQIPRSFEALGSFAKHGRAHFEL